METLNTSIKSLLAIDENIEDYAQLNSILLYHNIDVKLINNILNAENEIQLTKYDCYLIADVINTEKTTFLIDLIKIYNPGAVVILVAENPTAEMIIEYIPYGIDNVITKPFLWTSIENVLNIYNY
ncbi:MAG: hypothetical protein RBS16_04270 [Candidatus Cloacimonadales bacterium]|jgi:DNA-binding NtrC family response regulator|nr:hypothetical protein [Candidatus Cloacimonadota bacterium]MDX9977230.1 hypothetical protein [Candidatus Cloacimonadales bacterium]